MAGRLPTAFRLILLDHFIQSFFVESGMQLRGNFYKCGNLTEQKHYLSWNAIESDTPNFHKPECFGVLKLEA